MGIVWDYEALDDLESTLCYIETRFSHKEACFFRRLVIQVAKRLSQFPHLGKIELLLDDGPVAELRSIPIDSHCKLIYTVMPDNIFIIALWNTSRNPKSLEQEVRGRIR